MITFNQGLQQLDTLTSEQGVSRYMESDADNRALLVHNTRLVQRRLNHTLVEKKRVYMELHSSIQTLNQTVKLIHPWLYVERAARVLKALYPKAEDFLENARADATSELEMVLFEQQKSGELLMEELQEIITGFGMETYQAIVDADYPDRTKELGSAMDLVAIGGTFVERVNALLGHKSIRPSQAVVEVVRNEIIWPKSYL